jgi:polyferredoxin
MLRISSWNCLDVFRSCGFHPGIVGTFSEAADFVPESSGRFPMLRISSWKRRDTFRSCGFHPGSVGTFSDAADFVLESSGRFPTLRISSWNCRDVFRSCGFRPGSVGAFSEAADFIPEASGRFPKLRISSRNRQDVFRRCGFHPGSVGTFSDVADFIPESSGRFPKLRISSRNRRGVFRSCGFRPGIVGTFSEAANNLFTMRIEGGNNIMMKKLLFILFLTFPAVATAQNRFPKPDFESGYRYPAFTYHVPDEAFWMTLDVVLLVVLMSVVVWAVIRQKRRAPVVWVSVVSVAYFGFFRSGCVCSIGSIQNVALALSDSSYAMPLGTLLFFVLPVIFALLFGRVFCAGVCPMGALQELVNVKNFRLSRPVEAVLGIIPWIYLAFAVLYAVTRSSFLICRFDPFIGIFRMGGDIGMILFGALMLVAAVFTGRPFCRFLCPYGALLSLFSRVSVRRIKITPSCINCDLCLDACPLNAIRPPYENKVKESRVQGVKRILTYLIFLPVMTAAGAFLMYLMSDSLSHANKYIRLYDLVAQNEARPQEIPPLEVEVFYAQGGTLEELTVRAENIRNDFRRSAVFAGAFIGLVVGCTLIGLSLKRTRKTYEIDDAACVNCGRCFGYCPQNQSRCSINQKITK